MGARGPGRSQHATRDSIRFRKNGPDNWPRYLRNENRLCGAHTRLSTMKAALFFSPGLRVVYSVSLPDRK